jgi:hypothetical protein
LAIPMLISRHYDEAVVVPTIAHGGRCAFYQIWPLLTAVIREVAEEGPIALSMSALA